MIYLVETIDYAGARTIFAMRATWIRHVNLYRLAMSVAEPVGGLGRSGMARMSKTILTVDDSSTMRKLLRYTLTAQGHIVHDAEDGIAALEWLAENPQPDLLITDLNMPRMDGFGLVEAVRANGSHNDMPIIILSTENSDEKQAYGANAGANGWLVKPFDPARLATAIEMVFP